MALINLYCQSVLLAFKFTHYSVNRKQIARKIFITSQNNNDGCEEIPPPLIAG